MPTNALDVLAGIPAATIYEAAGKKGDVAPHIRAMVPGTRMAGPAYTIRTMPCESLPVLKAIAQAPPGGVLVIDAGDSTRSTIWGGTSSLAAKARGLGGVVTNACIRDIDEIIEIGLPVFAVGVSLRGTLKHYPGAVGETIAIGGVSVSPGDIVIGDSDGVLVVCAGEADQVARAALEQRAREEARDRRIRDGEDIATVLNLN